MGRTSGPCRTLSAESQFLRLLLPVFSQDNNLVDVSMIRIHLVVCLQFQS